MMCLYVCHTRHMSCTDVPLCMSYQTHVMYWCAFMYVIPDTCHVRQKRHTWCAQQAYSPCVCTLDVQESCVMYVVSFCKRATNHRALWQNVPMHVCMCLKAFYASCLNSVHRALNAWKHIHSLDVQESCVMCAHMTCTRAIHTMYHVQNRHTCTTYTQAHRRSHVACAEQAHMHVACAFMYVLLEAQVCALCFMYDVPLCMCF